MDKSVVMITNWDSEDIAGSCQNQINKDDRERIIYFKKIILHRKRMYKKIELMDIYWIAT